MMRALAIALCLGCAACPGPASGGGAQNGGSNGANPCADNPCGQTPSLYDRLGGLPNIRQVVDELIGTVAADARINTFFAHSNIRELKLHLVEHICVSAGGPCEYRGRDMKTAHEGLGVTEAHYSALVENLEKTLDKFGVPEKEQIELIDVLAASKADIIGNPQ
jgi:hemoglobin